MTVTPPASVERHSLPCMGSYFTDGCTCGVEDRREADGKCRECGQPWERCDDCSPRPEGEW